MARSGTRRRSVVGRRDWTPALPLPCCDSTRGTRSGRTDGREVLQLSASSVPSHCATRRTVYLTLNMSVDLDHVSSSHSEAHIAEGWLDTEVIGSQYVSSTVMLSLCDKARVVCGSGLSGPSTESSRPPTCTCRQARISSANSCLPPHRCSLLSPKPPRPASPARLTHSRQSDSRFTVLLCSCRSVTHEQERIGVLR